ncbi:MAG: sortase domain-bontaining protein [Acutalibacteraceae bacterium]
MKNIYEDGTVPAGPGPEKMPPQVSQAQGHPPVRPKKEIPLSPGQQARKDAGQPQPYPNAPYPYVTYVPVNPAYFDQNGRPVYPVPQPVYPGEMPPQGVPVQGVPMQGIPMQNMPPQGVPQPMPYAQYMPAYPPAGAAAPPEKSSEEDSQSAYNPGTRVLYQSPDFDAKEGDTPRDVGAGFARAAMHGGASVPFVEQEDFSVEEVSINEPPRITRSAPPIVTPRGVSVDEVFVSDFELQQSAIPFAQRENLRNIPVEMRRLKDEAFDEDITESQETEQPAEEVPAEKAKLSTGEIIRRVVLIISVIAIVVAGAMLLREFLLSRENKDVIDNVSGMIIEENTTAKKDDSSQQTTQVQLTPEQQWAKIRQDYPNVIFPANIQLKYAKLYAENQEFVGYLSAEGVNLSLPVVQTNNDSTYLNKNFYGKKTKYGCPFVTHLNHIEPLDMNTVIFGHHMNDGTIFGALDAYKKIDGFKAAPVITFNTLYTDYQWKVIAAFITNAEAKDDNGYIFRYYFTTLSTQERFSAYLSELAQRSLYDTGVDVLPTDKLLTLSTCSHEFTDARFVVVARMVRPGESAEVDTSKAAANPSPRYPQAYYTKKGMKNPYANATRWEVG